MYKIVNIRYSYVHRICPLPVSSGFPPVNGTLVSLRLVVFQKCTETSTKMPTSNNARASITSRQMSITAMKQEELLNAQTQYYIHREHANLSAWDRFKKYVWDPKKGRFCGRTASSWCKLLLLLCFSQNCQETRYTY